MIQIARALLRHDHWQIGWLPFGRPDDLSSAGVTWMRSKPDEFLADPFGFRRDGVDYVLYERYDYRRGIGRIYCSRVENDRLVDTAEVFADLPGHLSYPYLFSWEGSLYCIPETAGMKRLVVMKCISPFAWIQVATLFEGVQLVDATIFPWNGRLWLAASSVVSGRHDSLSMWSAEDVCGPWTAHAGNPVKHDITSARGAGTPFLEGRNLLRPAQNCREGYGSSITLNRIEALTQDTFHEVQVGQITDTSRGVDGVHTISLSRGGGLVWFDRRRRRFVAWQAYRLVRTHLFRSNNRE